jgi:hypothetical protein
LGTIYRPNHLENLDFHALNCTRDPPVKCMTLILR